MKVLSGMSNAIISPGVTNSYSQIPNTIINPLSYGVVDTKLLGYDPKYNMSHIERGIDARHISKLTNKLGECKYDKRRFKRKLNDCNKSKSKITEKLTDKSVQLRACKKYVKRENVKTKRNMKRLKDMYESEARDYDREIENLYESKQRSKGKSRRSDFKALMLANKQSKLIDKILDSQAKALPKRLTRKKPVKRKVVKKKAPVKRKVVKRIVFSDASEDEEGVVPYRNTNLKNSNWSAPLKISF